jgi:hypothetical protein
MDIWEVIATKYHSEKPFQLIPDVFVKHLANKMEADEMYQWKYVLDYYYYATINGYLLNTECERGFSCRYKNKKHCMTCRHSDYPTRHLRDCFDTYESYNDFASHVSDLYQRFKPTNPQLCPAGSLCRDYRRGHCVHFIHD